MAYRYDDKPPKPEDHLLRFDVRNGAIMRIAFGCFYAQQGHDPKLHDHYGWPHPRTPDNICQIKPVFDWLWHPFPNVDKPIKLEPIHLAEEGYTDVIVRYEDPEMEQYLETDAWIDEEDDYVVRMTVQANFPTFSDKPKDGRFTIFISSKNADGVETAIDAVCHAFVTVLPGKPYIN